MALAVVTAFLVSVAMSLAVAHALEWPGKRRLDLETYRAVQTIYYPGFTFGGFSEPGSIIATLALLWSTPRSDARFHWIVFALLCLVAMQAVYWLATHPVNRFWLPDVDLHSFSARFFGVDAKKHGAHAHPNDQQLWTTLRNRWEYSHIVRAILAAAALIAVLIGLATDAQIAVGPR